MLAIKILEPQSNGECLCHSIKQLLGAPSHSIENSNDNMSIECLSNLVVRECPARTLLQEKSYYFPLGLDDHK